MLTVKTTPHLYGISLLGDYSDLNEIYDALSRYLVFYQRHSESYPYHEYEYLLSLNYDIRHAYMGSRDYTLVENNAEDYGIHAEAIYELPESVKKEFSNIRKNFKKGNLYFEVKILYPLVFHYLASLERILDDYYLTDWFETDRNKTNEIYSPDYNELQANSDRAMIRMLTALLWNNASELFGEKKALESFSYYSDQEFGFAASIYIDALLHHMSVHFDSYTETEKKDYLYLCLMETLDSEELLDAQDEFPACYASYSQALKQIKGFPTQQTFFKEFHKEFDSKEHFYRNDFKKFLDTLYGPSNDYEEPDW